MDNLSLAEQLILANKALAVEIEQRKSREEQLIIANNELSYQNSEKEKRAAELVLANIELSYQNSEKEKRAAELVIANENLIWQHSEKEKRAEELINAYEKLKYAEAHLKGHISGLEEMMFMTSHKVRKPVANILGLTHLLEDFLSSPAKLRQLVAYLRISAQELDDFTKELTEFISNMGQKGLH